MAAPGRRRGGFSLLETLIALAVMSLAAAIVMTKAGGALDQVALHTAFFDFQRQVSDLRQQAFAQKSPIVLPPLQDAQSPKVTLQPGWTYRLSGPLNVSAAGVCGQINADLLHDGKMRAELQSVDGACRFVRLR